MGTRVAAVLAMLLALLATAAACSGDDADGDQPGSATTSDADCAGRIPDGVFDTLGWSRPKAAEATIRGCHRETEQGYVEVRDRTGDYGKLCSTLDRSGEVGPGLPPEWLAGYIACAVEPAGDVGQTRVLVKRNGDGITQVTVAVLSRTDRAKVRAAVAALVATTS